MGTSFPKRRPPGRFGGRPVRRAFYFIERDGDNYPSESVKMRNSRLPDDPNKLMSWTWALTYADANDLWLVVPIHGIDEVSVRKDTNLARASVWRTGHRQGLEMTSEYIYPNLYIRVVGDEA